MTQRDDELDVGKKAGCDLTPHHHVGDGRLEAHGLPGQLTEQLLAEQNILSRLELLLPVELHRLGGWASQVGRGDQLLIVALYGHLDVEIKLSISLNWS